MRQNGGPEFLKDMMLGWDGDIRRYLCVAWAVDGTTGTSMSSARSSMNGS